MRYHDVKPIAREEAIRALSSQDSESLCDALIRVAYHDPDWRWVQDECIRLAKHVDPHVRGLAATCFGHLVRIHHALDLDKVVPVLDQLCADPEVSGQARDALDDIKTFMNSSDI